MTITTVDKDILTVTEGIIAHQVNMQGVMGAGLARQIKNKYPDVFDRYYHWYKTGSLFLGLVHSVKVSDRVSRRERLYHQSSCYLLEVNINDR